VRRAAKVLKKKDPGQFFSALCQQLAQCAPETLRREKTLTQNEKPISSTTAPAKISRNSPYQQNSFLFCQAVRN
jgi:hypothetical protein